MSYTQTRFGSKTRLVLRLLIHVCIWILLVITDINFNNSDIILSIEAVLIRLEIPE